VLFTSSEGSAFSLAVLQAATQTHSCNSSAEAHFRAHAGLCGLTASRLGPCLLPLTEQACVARRSAASWSGASLPLRAARTLHVRMLLGENDITASHVRALAAAGSQPGCREQRSAVRQTDQVLLFLPRCGTSCGRRTLRKIQIAASPSWVSFQRMAGDVCKAESVKGITCPSPHGLPFSRAFLTLFLTGTFSLISSLFSRSIPCSLSAPLLSSFAHLAHLSWPACPFLPPALVSQRQWAVSVSPAGERRFSTITRKCGRARTCLNFRPYAR